MTFDLQQMPKVMSIYLQLSEYPILARKIREQMRRELFERGVITMQQFEQEVEAKAIVTQEKERLSDPLEQESAADWAERVRIVRDYLTDFYFALNLPHDRFEEIVRTTLVARKPNEEVVLTFNPELAPWNMLFAQAEEYERLPSAEKALVRHHLQEIVVVLIRGLISDQLGFVGVAREVLDIFDLKEIRRHRIGRGKIGGKAAGMMLAHKILRTEEPEDPFPLSEHVTIPDSYFVGADVYYDFMAHNELYRFSDQKYKVCAAIEADYPEIERQFVAGEFPVDVVEQLKRLLADVGNCPLIVRSSSLLEDNFGMSFAGKYESYFCPNQGAAGENLAALLDAIRRVYATVLNPDALFYRQRVGLLDYDERMAILIQRVEGEQYGRYFFPAVAGVAFGRNPFRWNRMIRREDGFMRIVLGLGTRAVDRVANDYPRMVALSHPRLRPEITAAEVRRYAQHFVDVIDLEGNRFETLPLGEVIRGDYPSVEYLVSVDEGDYVAPLAFHQPSLPPSKMVLTFDRLLQDSAFVPLMKAILHKLERAYNRPVDIEFTLEIQPGRPHPHLVVHLLQCRPLSSRESEMAHQIPPFIAAEDVVLASTRLVPDGIVPRIAYVVYIDPARYSRVPDHATKFEIGRVVGRLNQRLEGRRYILIGPGRWGSSNIDLGVRVRYADIHNAAMLVEVAFRGADGTPELSYGTHFYQDLVEANIHSLSLYPDEEGTVLNRDFFDSTPNALASLSPGDKGYADYVKVIDVRAATAGRLLEAVMNAEEEKAVVYLRAYTDG